MTLTLKIFIRLDHFILFSFPLGGFISVTKQAISIKLTSTVGPVVHNLDFKNINNNNNNNNNEEL